MDKFELRRTHLIALVKVLGRGGINHIATKIGKEPSYVSRMLAEPEKAGRKRITENFADLLDAAFPGWQTGSFVPVDLSNQPLIKLAPGAPVDINCPWPFPDIDQSRFANLQPRQQIEIQGLVRARLEKFEEINQQRKRA